MSQRNIENLLSYHCLTGPLVTNPVSDLDKAINKLRMKYRSYTVEYDVEAGAVQLPGLFVADFVDQVTRFANLVDTKNNQIEVVVERINGAVFFSKGWKAIGDFYGIGLGAWITLVFIGQGQFAMVLKDRFGKTIKPPIFDPPMRFVVDRTSVQLTFNDHLPPFTYRHNINDMQIDFVKRLTEYDVTKGFLMLIYEGKVETMLDRATTSLKLVDDCGNRWECLLIFGTVPYDHCMIGGEWKRFVEACKLREGVRIRLGVPMAGVNDTVYLTVVAN